MLESIDVTIALLNEFAAADEAVLVALRLMDQALFSR